MYGGYFKKPEKTAAAMPPEMRPEIYGGRGHAYNWTKPEAPPQPGEKNLTRAEIRAVTPEGFARAFFKANR
jgi:hypothetical protein